MVSTVLEVGYRGFRWCSGRRRCSRLVLEALGRLILTQFLVSLDSIEIKRKQHCSAIQRSLQAALGF